MPEGPEIRRAADKIASVLVGYKTTRVEFSSDDLKQFEKILIGRSVTGVQTRGKAMLTCFEHDWVLKPSPTDWIRYPALQHQQCAAPLLRVISGMDRDTLRPRFRVEPQVTRTAAG